MSNDNLKAEKKFKVNLLGVVEEVKERPPARDADLVRKTKPRKIVNALPTDSNGKEKVAYHEKTSSNSGDRKHYTYEKDDAVTNGTAKRSGQSKTNGKTKEVTKYGDYTSALVALAFVLLYTLFNNERGDENVNNVLPTSDKEIVDSTGDTILSIFFGLVKGLFEIIFNIIEFFINIIFTILGL